MKFIKFQIHGAPATYSLASGWKCDDALAQKFLTAACTPRTPSFTEATRLVKEQYGDGAQEQRPEDFEGEDEVGGAAIGRQYDEINADQMAGARESAPPSEPEE